MTIDIRGLDKAEVLAALYNRSQPLGLGILHYTPQDMEIEEAQKLIDENKHGYYDYLKGRVMKVSLIGDEFEERLYDRDNGQGAAFRVIEKLRAKKASEEKES